LALVTLVSGPTLAALAAEAPSDEPTVSLTLRDTPLRAALELLFQQTGKQHAVESSVPNIPITLNLRDAPFATALRVITRLAGVTYRKDGEITVIGLRPPPAVESAAAIEVTPPEATERRGETVEKIPVLYGNAAILGYVFGSGGVIPTEEALGLGNGAGGYGPGNGFGSFGAGGLGTGIGSGLGSFGPFGGLGSSGGLNGFTGFGNTGGIGNPGTGGSNTPGYFGPVIRSGGRF
jgi:hypothetical protein